MLPTLKDAMRSCMEDNSSTSHSNTSESNQDALSRRTNISELFCDRIWDGILCWGPIPANTIAYAACPEYPYNFDTSRTASKFCTETGSWYHSPELGQPWTNYSQCMLGRRSAIHSENITFFEPHLGTIKMMSKVGYTVSFISLVIALTILVSIKKLRCPRNSLHVHLFLSFIFRALAVLVKDAIFVEGVGLSTNLDFTQNNVDCKVFTSIWHYVLMANYCWILMEGLYLHNLIFLAFFTDSSGIIKYVVLGWGLPLVFLIPWIIVRATLEDTLCWTTNETQSYFWIIRGPITVSILVNFVMFINVTRVLLVKLFTPQACEARRYRYRKWFKSTLVLVPLFGAHYAFLLGMSLAAAGDLLELVWLYIDQLFSSFQGFLVATLYCFLNTEVSRRLGDLLSPPCLGDGTISRGTERRRLSTDRSSLQVGTQARKALFPARFSWRRVRPAPSNGPRHLSVLTQSFTLVTRASPANHTLPHKDVAAHI